MRQNRFDDWLWSYTSQSDIIINRMVPDLNGNSSHIQISLYFALPVICFTRRERPAPWSARDPIKSIN